MASNPMALLTLAVRWFPSTPIGYSLSNFHFAGTLSNTSDYQFFRLPHVTGAYGEPDSLGDASITGGASLGKFGAISGTVMFVDSSLQTAFNAQYGAPLLCKNIGVSVGVQDIAGTGYDRAYGIAGARSSQSFFGAVSAPLGSGIYASAGWGTRRFGKGFANVSVPIGTRFKAVLEEDGLGVNEMIAWDPRIAGRSKLFGRNVSTTVMLGFVRSHYAIWALNFGL